MRQKQNKPLLYVLVFVLMITALSGCNTVEEEKQSTPIQFKDGSYAGNAEGYGGPVRVEVSVTDGRISDIQVVEHHESSPVYSRAFPLLRERILEAQSPQVDSVSAASFTSFAVKSAVADAMKESGHDFGEIAFLTTEEKTEPKELKDVETDIVIVGAGPAGLSAAIAAKEVGADNIIVIEKMDILSGNGKFDMNFFDLIHSKAQREQGIELGIDDFVAMKEKTTDSAARKRAWGEGSFQIDDWFRGMGIELNFAYGETNHMHEADAYAGEHIQEKLEEKVQELDIEVRTGTKGTDLLMENEKAVGVSVEDREGTYDISAKAVIIATGGFAANKELLQKFVPGSEMLATSNQMGATGDFVEVFEKHNLKLNNMNRLNLFPFIVKKSRDLTGGADDFILVNKEGNRFISEKARGLDFAHTILAQSGKSAFYIYDQNAYESAYRLQKHVDLGYHKKADTLTDLAELLGIDAGNLEATVKVYNDAILRKGGDPYRGDDVFDRPFANEGPYYGVEVESAVHMTLGGVVANEKAQVLNQSDQPVEGLYAAGEVTDVSGAYNAAIVFGRISGQEAGQYVLGK